MFRVVVRSSYEERFFVDFLRRLKFGSLISICHLLRDAKIFLGKDETQNRKGRRSTL